MRTRIVGVIPVGKAQEVKQEITKTPSDPSVLLVRKWRLGDIVMLLPIAHHLIKEGKRVTVATREEYKTILDFAYPAISFCNYSNYIAHGYDEVFNLDKLVINQPNIHTKVDMFFHLANINPQDAPSKTPKIVCKLNEIENTNKLFESKKIDDRINIVVSTEGFNPQSPRSMELNCILDVFIANPHYNFIIVGRNPMKCPVLPNILNWTGNTPTLEKLIGIINRCDAVITVDTGMLHLAGALGKQTLAIFGPTRPEFLASFYRNLIVLDANKECSPCWEKGCKNNCLRKLPQLLVNRYLSEVLNGYDGYKVVNFGGDIINES